MKTVPSSALLPAALLAALALPSTASAFAELARGALTLTTTGRLSYDTNILGNATELDDTLFTLNPSLLYRRAAGLGSLEASGGVAINRYFDYTGLDGEDYFASLRIDLPTPEGANQDGSFSAGYSDSTDIDNTVGARIRARTWNTRFAGTYRVGPRLDLRGSVDYADTTRDLYADRTQWSAGAGFDYHEFLGGFGLKGDYRYADTDSSSHGSAGALDQQSHSVSSGLFYTFASGLRASADAGYRWTERDRSETLEGDRSEDGMTFGLSLKGPFLPPSRFPKLESSFSIGYQKADALGLGDHGHDTVVGSLALAWQARERTSLKIGADRRQGLSADNYSTVSTSVHAGVTQQIGHHLQATADLAHEWVDFPSTDRNDRRLLAGLHLVYVVNRTWSAGANYNFTHSRSTNDSLDYERDLVSVQVACTF